MITPSRQSNPSAISQASPGKSKDSVSFHGFSISQLPADVLPGITCYLSMREVLALGQVCRGLRSNLQRCGVITDICNYLSLPKGLQWSIHYFVTGNRLLIDHLRKNPAAYNKSFPIQHSPAIYTKYASYFRECMVRASSVTLVPSGLIECHETSYKLNSQHNCLLQECNDTNQLLVWTNQKDGSWKCEHTADIDLWGSEINRIKHGAQTLFIDGDWDEDTHLRIIERNELGKWNETKRLYPSVILDTTDDLFIHQVDLANNQRVMLFLLDHYLSKKSALLIVGLDADGRWRTKGRFQFCGKIMPDLARFRFSHDCRHAAGFTTKLILFVSEQDDGTWIETGKIRSEGEFFIESLKFSTDDRHSVLCGEDIGSDVLPWRDDTCVIVVSQDDHGHWSETQRITRYCDGYTELHPHARFSVDSKQLFASIDRQLIILSLHEGKWVLSTDQLNLRGDNCKIKTSMDPSSFMVIADKTAWFFAMDASGAWGKPHEFYCYEDLPPKISPEGDTVVCLYEHDRPIEIWTRTPPDQWIKQQFSIYAYRAEFSPDGSLVALAGSCDSLTLLGRTEKGEWQKKAEQRIGDFIVGLSFSPCGRSIRVDYEKWGDVTVSFWQIVPQPLRE